jgi:hypothetical protein
MQDHPRMATTLPLIILEDANLADAEQHLCTAALEYAGNISEAAKLLGITRHALARRIRKHAIDWPPRSSSVSGAVLVMDRNRPPLARGRRCRLRGLPA